MASPFQMFGGIAKGLGGFLGRLFGGGSSPGTGPGPGPQPETHATSNEPPPLDDLDSGETDGITKFLAGQEHRGFESSNVAAGQYSFRDHMLDVGFKNPRGSEGWYEYQDVLPPQAKAFYEAMSKGKWIWDKLRVRGTVFGFQKPYRYLRNRSQGYTPKYWADQGWRQEHRTIGPEGETPYSWRQGEGPYGTTQFQSTANHPWGPSPEEMETRPGQKSMASRLAEVFEAMGMSDGGEVEQRFGSGGDDEPAFLSPGELVIPRKDVEGHKEQLASAFPHLFNQPDSVPKHYAAGGFVGNLVPRLPDPFQTVARGYFGSQGGITGAIAAMLPALGRKGAGAGAGAAGPSSSDALIEAARQLKEAARQLSDVATHQFNQPPPAGSIFSSQAWVQHPGSGQWGLMSRGPLQQHIRQLPRGSASPTTAGIDLTEVFPQGEAASAGEAGAGAGAGAAAAAAGLALIGLVVVASKLKDAFVDLTKMALHPESVIHGMVAPFQSQVAAFNPASVERFNLALDNLSAAVGSMFAPAIDAAREFADEMNVLYTSVAPDIRGLITDIIPLIREPAREFAVGFIGLLRDMATGIRPFLTDLLPIARGMGGLFRDLFQVVGPLVSLFSQLGGLTDIPARLLGFSGTLQMSIVALENFIAAIRTGIQAVHFMVEHPIDAATGGMGGGSTAGALGLLATLGPLFGGAMIAANLGNQWAGGGGIGVNGNQFDWDAAFRRNREEARSPGQPLSGAMTAAAQPARQVGIEQVGMEARASAFSMAAADPNAQTARNTEETVRVLGEIQTTLQPALDRIQEIMQFFRAAGVM